LAGDANGLDGGADVVHTKDRGAVHEGVGIEHGGAVETVVGRAAKQAVDHALARYANEERLLEAVGKLAEGTHERIVLL